MTKPTLFCGLSAGLPAPDHFRPKPHPVFGFGFLCHSPLYTQYIAYNLFVFCCKIVFLNFAVNISCKVFRKSLFQAIQIFVIRAILLLYFFN